ncbi:hypothetical protein V8E53_004333 [Lactarius tabidus]
MSLYDSSVRPESKSTQIWTPPQPYYADESKYLAILDPYPPNANLDLYPDQRALVLWLASRAGKEVLRTLFHKSSFPDMVVVEVNYDFHKLLGQHVWSEFLMEPTKEHMGRSSTVFDSNFNRDRLFSHGWTHVKIEEHWFQGWSDNHPQACNFPFIKYPYTESSQCDAASKSVGGEPVCHLLPQQPFALPLPPTEPPVGSSELLAVAARHSNAGPPSSSTKKGTAAPSDTVSVPNAGSKSTKSFSLPIAQSHAPSSVVANHRTKRNTRKRGPSSVSTRPSVASRAPGAFGSSTAQSSRGAPPAFLGPGRRPASPSRTPEQFNRSASEDVEHFELEQVNNAPACTPTPTHSSRPERRQLDHPLGSIEPSRLYEYNEEDEPRHSTEAAMADLFDDGFMAEDSSARSGDGGTRALGPDDPDYDPYNSPAEPVNLWEGYDTPRLELPTKVKKNGEWTCSQHGSLCTPGICKERAKFERDDRMRNNREKWEDERVPRSRGKRGRPRKGTRAAVTGEWRSSPPHLGGNSSSATTATTATTTSNSTSNNGSDSDTADTSRNQGSTAPLQLEQDGSSIDGFRLNAGDTDTMSVVSSARGAFDLVTGSDNGDHDDGASIAQSHAPSIAASRISQAEPPASVGSRGQKKKPASPAPPSNKVSPTSPRPTPQQPSSNIHNATSQSPSVSKHSVVPSLTGNSRPASVSAASSNTAGPATRKSAPERSSVSSRARAGAHTPSTSSVANGLPEDANSIAAWLAKVRAETAKPDGRRNGRKAADAGGRQKVSKGARQRQNKPKTARAQAQAEEQEALASIIEAEVEVEPSFEGPENEWGDPKMLW